MCKIKNICIAGLLAVAPGIVAAQSGTNSPYSQYGFGELTEQSTGFNRGMNGVGLGYREHNQVNFLNPASYSAVDSMSFIFDVGIAGQLTNFEEGGRRLNANNANLEYISALFRAARHIGIGFGLMTYTNVGYSYSSSSKISSDESGTTTYTNTYSGSGGLHQAYLGFGWEPFKGLAIGVNGSYLWGSIDRSVVNSYSDVYINTLSKYYSADVRNFKVDFGLQFTARLSKNDKVTLGATYSLGHKLGTDPECKVISRNSQTSVSDTTVYTIDNAFELPSVYGGGFLWNHKNKLRIGADYTLQKWAGISFPMYDSSSGTPQYALRSGMFKDRHKVNVGVEFVADEDGRSYLKKIRYRIGAGYATPYQVINGIDGPKEYSVSAGLGIPITNRYNNRSILNISGQWICRDAKSLIKENSFRINIGLTFNERWFAKWKVQ